MWNDAVADRRNAPRRQPAGVLVARTRGRTVRGWIADLSTSGVRFRVESRIGIHELTGRDVGVELHFDRPGTKCLYLRGRVVRVSDALLTIVIAFEGVPTGLAVVMDREGLDAVLH